LLSRVLDRGIWRLSHRRIGRRRLFLGRRRRFLRGLLDRAV